jgi:transglutaminase-like putative cysteine protease
MRRTAATLIVLFAACSVLAQAPAAPRQRHFTFHYSFVVKSVATGKRLHVWIPLAHTDPWQQVRLVSQKGDLPLTRTQDPEYGNWMLHAEEVPATKTEYKFSVDYDIVRSEHIVLTNGQSVARTRQTERVQLARFLQPDKLVPTTGLPAQLAIEQTKGANTQLEKARAIYDYVFRTMRYDKSGTGWGHGDTLWACDSKRGNCTDFHSVFISMSRSQRIPSRFEIGFSIPPDQHAAQITSYHCWAEFYIDSIGWIPIDISEASKHQELHDYYFGGHDPNRVQFTVGRDLKLSPPQAGPSLNYFVYPYVESGGKEHSNVSIDFSFQDVDRPAADSTAAN